jgi:hypothetical protein
MYDDSTWKMRVMLSRLLWLCDGFTQTGAIGAMPTPSSGLFRISGAVGASLIEFSAAVGDTLAESPIGTLSGVAVQRWSRRCVFAIGLNPDRAFANIGVPWRELVTAMAAALPTVARRAISTLKPWIMTSAMFGSVPVANSIPAASMRGWPETMSRGRTKRVAPHGHMRASQTNATKSSGFLHG